MSKTTAENTGSPAVHSDDPSHSKASLWTLALGSVGVVYGDIGTSPLYAMREALHPVVAAGGDLRLAVLGVASLLIWSLITTIRATSSGTNRRHHPRTQRVCSSGR